MGYGNGGVVSWVVPGRVTEEKVETGIAIGR